MPRTKRPLEFGLVALLFLVVTGISLLVQRPISYQSGYGWDGAIYGQAAAQLANGQLPHADAPFVGRIGTPFLVALLFPHNLLLGFLVVNIVANLITVLLLLLWLRCFLDDWHVRVLIVGLFVLHWIGPVRFVAFYPAYTDPWLFVFLLAGMLLIQRYRDTRSTSWLFALCGVTFIGVLFRESAAVLGLALLGIARLGDRLGWHRAALALPLLCCGLGLLAVRLLTEPSNAYSFLIAAYTWAYKKPLLTYMHAYFITFGPALALLVVYWRTVVDFLRDQRHLLIYLVAFAALAWIGGSDTERILLWSAPVVLVLVGRVLEKHRPFLSAPVLAVCLLAAQLLSERVFWTIPDYPSTAPTPWPLLSIPSSNFQYLDLYSFHGQQVVQAKSLFEYAALSAFFFWWLSRRTTAA